MFYHALHDLKVTIASSLIIVSYLRDCKIFISPVSFPRIVPYRAQSNSSNPH